MIPAAPGIGDGAAIKLDKRPDFGSFRQALRRIRLHGPYLASRSHVARRQELEAVYPGTVSEVFAALGRTLSFRRWGLQQELLSNGLPRPGQAYRHRTGSVLRIGRVVDVTRPVGLTLKEALQDSPCRVLLTLRWRIDPVSTGSSVRLNAVYRLNHAAVLRGRHWDRRLRQHFCNQFRFVAVNLNRMHDKGCVKRELTHL